MNALSFNAVDYIVFAGFFIGLSIIGYLAGRGEQKTSDDYFLAGRKLPWYVVGSSFIASNISSEHFIGMVGAAFIFGVGIAMWEWAVFITLTLMIFIIVPIFITLRITTIPELLETYFGRHIRTFFALVTVVINVLTFMAAVLYAGGLALQILTGFDLWLCILVVGFVSGIWAVYGGLSSVAWTDLFTVIVMFIGGTLVTILGLKSLAADGSILEGFSVMMERNAATEGVWKQAVETNLPVYGSGDSYNRLSVFHNLNHPLVPVSGIVFGVLSIGVWYTVLNQFIIQRVLAAKDLWHARMGLVLMGYAKIFMPFLIVMPGLILFAQHPEYMTGEFADTLKSADKGYVSMVEDLLPAGLRGLVIAALFGTIQSTVNSVLNSTATILTLDIYKPLINKQATDRQLVKFGFNTSIIALIVAILIAFAITLFKGGIFQYIQTLNAFFAPPFAAMFLLALFFRKTTRIGSVAVLIVGFAVVVALKAVGGFNILPSWLVAFPNQAGLSWTLAIIAGVIVSLLTQKSVNPEHKKLADAWRNKAMFTSFMGEHWYSSVLLWWALFMLGIFAVMAYFSGMLTW